MSQGDLGTLVAAETSGAELAARLTTWRDALHTQHSGSQRPSYLQAGGEWLDTSVSPWVLKFWTGVMDVDVMSIDPTTGVTRNLETRPQNTIYGRMSEGSGAGENLTVAQLRQMLSLTDYGIAEIMAQYLAGEYVYLPAGVIPAGRRIVRANGATLNRADFPYLWSFAQNSAIMAPSEGQKSAAQFGPGNGSTTFTVPDARGYFLRAWDNGRGIDPGRALNEIQQTSTQDHRHLIGLGYDPEGRVYYGFENDGTATFGSVVVTAPRGTSTFSGTTTAAARRASTSGLNNLTGESRPINLAAILGIRY